MSITDFTPEKCRRFHSAGGWSHRKLAAHFGVTLRMVQKAIDPEKRREQDCRRNQQMRSPDYRPWSERQRQQANILHHIFTRKLERDDVILAAVERGVSYRNIAAALDLSPGYCWRIAARLG